MEDKNLKAILLDADGVVLVKQGYFSEKFSDECNVPLELITPFFKNEFRVCQLGKADLKEVLLPYLQQWGWQDSVDSFLRYWFTSDTQPDQIVLDKVQQLRNRSLKCYLVTDQEKYRAKYIREELGFNSRFDDCFFSYDLGYSKSEASFFEKVLAKITTAGSETLYFDDEEKNIITAKQLGIDARLYRGREDLSINNP
jgi:putative hydrolase of the HAD superfamily